MQVEREREREREIRSGERERESERERERERKNGCRSWWGESSRPPTASLSACVSAVLK